MESRIAKFNRELKAAGPPAPKTTGPTLSEAIMPADRPIKSAGLFDMFGSVKVGDLIRCKADVVASITNGVNKTAIRKIYAILEAGS